MTSALPIRAVPGFEHRPGNHCGSTALADLLRFHGVEISEELAFGLGAGPCFYYLRLDDQSPSRFTNGRTGRLEETFLEITAAPLRLRTAADPDEGWRLAAEAIDEGRPVLLLTDLFYLDHYGRSAHFPGHAVVLVGYDADSAWVADTGFEELQRTSLEGLARARYERHPYYPLTGQMVDLPPGSALDAEALLASAPAAIERAASLMRDPRRGDLEGLPALRRFVDELGGWPEQVSDWQWCARFNYQVIERRGTGGGNFRAMYARFLDEVGESQGSALAVAAAERWTALAEILFEASELADPAAEIWERAAAAAAEVLVAEERLWSALG